MCLRERDARVFLDVRFVLFLVFQASKVLTVADYMVGKEKMHPKITCHVENVEPKLSRKAQLKAYDGCARLRPIWDEIASKYKVVLTPSTVDVAPIGIGNTGDAVS